ncbi:hypothetical protein [Candidatus Reidiella endopervernicosa]|uniref:Uncharacterized protein n=1 Tax=Candidatus Reidiella endopervernicosa TaxID=2738883 RepID=A0A6N0I0B1_9GAMM|nr:hypothetical protein [Candidatus Reidiella endopervernicosa]QKQ28009.1 hypothetical protein HUE57_18260 [Candidatus Reidiella endopervernicosa]
MRKVCFGHQPKQTAKLNATVYAFERPDRSCVRCVITLRGSTQLPQ